MKPIAAVRTFVPVLLAVVGCIACGKTKQQPEEHNEPTAQKQSSAPTSYTTDYCGYASSYPGVQRVHISSTLAEQMTRKTVQPRPVSFAGDALVMVLVGRDGKVFCALGLEGQTELVNAASEAVSQWEYAPYILDGQPVVFETHVTLHFKPNAK